MQKINQQIERIYRWREAFCDDTTGIRTTVEDLLWDYAAFQTTVKIVQISSERKDEAVVLNQMLFDLLRQGYWSSLLLGTRRLLDRGCLNGKQGVYSIRSVVNDVKAFRDRLNRKMYVENVKGAEYDIKRLRQEMNAQHAATKGPVWASKELIESDAAHRCFDELSGVSPSDRSCDDLIDLAIFDKIEARLAALEKICRHVDVHVAHSGNKESRGSKKALENFDIQDARTTLKQLKEVSTLIGIWFANESSGDLATPLCNQFEGIDQPFVSSCDIQKLEDHWRAMDRDVAKWNISAEEL